MEHDLYDIRNVKNLMTTFGLSFRKEFGQNFLTDKEIVCAIADMCASTSDQTILEIGPGIGTLTQELARRYKSVYAIEIDKGLIPLLRYTLEDFKNAHVIQQDVLKADLMALWDQEMGRDRVSVCANLPYYITTPILLKLLKSEVPFESVTVMVQKEVADRLCAPVGGKDSGAVTAYFAYYGRAEIMLDVPSSSFVPAPKVDSCVIRLHLYEKKPVVPTDEDLFFKTIRVIFEQRRKTIQNALILGFPELDKPAVAEILERAGIDPLFRGEKLDLPGFARLSDEIGPYIKKPDVL